VRFSHRSEEDFSYAELILKLNFKNRWKKELFNNHIMYWLIGHNLDKKVKKQLQIANTFA
jgi:hypothetical protein